ncbi:TrmH family RNA methyltransferase [Denitratisoma oestradiolicum]|uniref:Uncharacterized protein n=1 Tax=Denitratisoma oestradiolicum TaxID=311182 RepID=A0A6S6XYX0_9PROT|nr:RNA methyltransferase [Denitratisoma oestradiolicum]TWO79539.1 rRNA methyltransferase [Denitratisoma oestradiolicum]CAB1368072.1 conserved protein of unknown function [Denitratisoma oestradiolicum]
MKTLSSRDNPTVRQLRLLAEDAREQRRQGRTLLDGPHLVSTYRQRVGLPRLLVVSESGLDKPELEALLALHPGQETLCLKDSLFREISGTAAPVGILALIDIPATPPGPARGSCLLLDAVQDAGNLGSILRTAAAAGLGDIFLGPGCAGVWTPKVLRAGQGAHFSLAIRERADLAAVIRGYPGRVLTTAVEGGQSLYALDLRGSVAWLFGSEGRGVDSSLASLAQGRVTIPLISEMESLNVAAAAAICIYESVRQNGNVFGSSA